MNSCLCGCGAELRPGKEYVSGHWSRTEDAKAMYAARRKAIEPVNPTGLCGCGCGEPTPSAEVTRISRGYVKGQPQRFINGHSERGKRGPQTSRWKGGRIIDVAGYVRLFMPDHPEATKRDGYVLEHRLVAAERLGRPLLKRERVRHINGIKADNRPENLEVLANQSEHKRLHGADELRRYHAANPGKNAEGGRKGAAVRWAKPGERLAQSERSKAMWARRRNTS